MLTAAVTSPALTATGVQAGVETEAAVADKVPVVAAKAQKVAAVTVANCDKYGAPRNLARGETLSKFFSPSLNAQTN